MDSNSNNPSDWKEDRNEPRGSDFCSRVDDESKNHSIQVIETQNENDFQINLQSGNNESYNNNEDNQGNPDSKDYGGFNEDIQDSVCLENKPESNLEQCKLDRINNPGSEHNDKDTDNYIQNIRKLDTLRSKAFNEDNEKVVQPIRLNKSDNPVKSSDRQCQDDRILKYSTENPNRNASADDKPVSNSHSNFKKTGLLNFSEIETKLKSSQPFSMFSSYDENRFPNEDAAMKNIQRTYHYITKSPKPSKRPDKHQQSEISDLLNNFESIFKRKVMNISKSKQNKIDRYSYIRPLTSRVDASKSTLRYERIMDYVRSPRILPNVSDLQGEFTQRVFAKSKEKKVNKSEINFRHCEKYFNFLFRDTPRSVANCDGHKNNSNIRLLSRLGSISRSNRDHNVLGRNDFLEYSKRVGGGSRFYSSLIARGIE